MRKTIFWLAILALVFSAPFVACKSSGNTADDTADDDNDDDDTGDDTGDDTAADDDLDDDIDDDADDDSDDDTVPTYECDPPSGLQTTLCNPVYGNTPAYSVPVHGWPLALTVTFDGQFLTGDQLALDCQAYGQAPWPVPLTPYWGGPSSGLISTQFIYPDMQLGPFYENQSYDQCKLYAADVNGITISNQVNISVTLGPKS